MFSSLISRLRIFATAFGVVGLFLASSAEGATIPYELVIHLQPGSQLLITAGGPTFSDASFAPNAAIAADAFSFGLTFNPFTPTFTLAGCGSLTGHVNGAGAAVTALSGTCTAEGGGAETIAFSSDNTAFIELLPGLLALNATYALVPEPAPPLLAGLAAAFVWGLRRRV